MKLRREARVRHGSASCHGRNRNWEQVRDLGETEGCGGADTREGQRLKAGEKRRSSKNYKRW